MTDQQHHHQQRSITKQLHESAPDSRRAVKFLTAATMGAIFLGLSGVTLTGTVICLIVATPLLVIFSPVLVPATITVFMLMSGFLFSGGCGVAAMSAVSWMYRYFTGKHPPGANQLNKAGERVTGTARDMKDRAKEHGQHFQHKAQDAT